MIIYLIIDAGSQLSALNQFFSTWYVDREEIGTVLKLGGGERGDDGV